MCPRLLCLLAVLILGGCASATAPGHPRAVSLVLDFTPNAVHAGIYSALARGYDRRNGVRVHVLVPSASTDSIKLLETGRVSFAILDIHDLAIAREQGADLVGLMAIVERPLASVIAAPDIADPRQLIGRTVGITGVPSDTAVLDSIVSGAGGDPRRVRTLTIGYDAVADLLAGRVAAATAFWNDEGITLQRRRPGFHVFRVDAFGAPPYPELLLCATAATVHSKPGLTRDVVRALAGGYAFAVDHPVASASDLERLVPGLDRTLVAAELAALRPAFTTPGGGVGALDRTVLQAWASWEVRMRIVSERPDVGATFDFGLGG